MNKYNSKLDTFNAMDLYNLVMPVVPPADMTLTPSLFTPRYLSNRGSGSGSLGQVFGFGVTDNPYLRGAGLFSNMADGLVDENTNHGSNALALNLSVDRFAAALTGTLINTAGSATVTGAGTAFTTELVVGATIVWADDSGNVRVGVINTITNATTLTLTAVTSNLAASMFSGVNTAAGVGYILVLPGPTLSLNFATLNTVYPMDFFLADTSKNLALTGVLTFTAGSAAVTGAGTSFTTQISVGQILRYVDFAGVQHTVRVTVITSDTALTLSAVIPAAGSGTYNAAVPGTIPAQLTSFLGVRAKWVGTSNVFSTISIDPQYQTKRLMFHAVCNIEHNSDLSQSW